MVGGGGGGGGGGGWGEGVDTEDSPQDSDFSSAYGRAYPMYRSGIKEDKSWQKFY